MNNNEGKSVMNFTQSRHNSSGSKPPLQLHNFMPMPSSSVHVGHDQNEEERRACYMNKLKANMESFWRERLSEIYVRTPNSLPLTRIRKVIKSDGKVEMISADTPVLFAKACEIFVMELTLHASMHTQENKRQMMQRSDIADAIRNEHLLSFLNHVVPMEPHHHQEPDLPILNHHGGVYVPQTFQEVPITPPTYPAYLQPSESEVGAMMGHPLATNDHHLAIPVNLHDNFNNDFFTKSGGILNNPSFPSSDDNVNVYHSFKVCSRAN
ncbi:hypothetical protein C2S53_009663 [Perilla frutescens var. hirtella]|uniref:Core Histone H2A/H2B/H3 domain-containing protein n=1 Tax=Perilla frutescens var. hirtella TaxID=608512 RepID=A0AAD4IW59_PERFH|nr:hypothetical protein C2S53_009663 [Perilla frutescens var. hirtella]